MKLVAQMTSLVSDVIHQLDITPLLLHFINPFTLPLNLYGKYHLELVDFL